MGTAESSENATSAQSQGAQHQRWMRKPRVEFGIQALKAGEQSFFYDKISNSDIVVALVPIFLVLVLLLNLIA